jgi:hypothetical protein
MSDDNEQTLPVVDAEFAEVVPVKRGRHKKGNTRNTSAKKQAKILELSAKNMTCSDISRTTGVPISTVNDIRRKFSKVFKELPRVEEYRNIKSDLLSAAQLSALESAFSGTKLKKAGFLSTLQGVEILNKMERLDSDKSTENYAHAFGIVPVKKKGES